MNREEARLDAILDAILARGQGLGGPRHDAILAEVLRQTAAPEPARPRRRLLFTLFAGAVLVPGLAVLLVVLHTGPRVFTSKGTSKGQQDQSTSAIDIGCATGGARRCRLGETLMFTVNAALTSGYLGAFAEPLGAGPAGGRIDYFPTAAGTSPLVSPGQGTVVVPEGVALGAPHAPGRYRVTVWLASRPQPAAALATDAGVKSRATFELEILPP